MRYLLSVDGGGTKTEFCISDINGNVIKSFFTGSTNYKSVGIEETFLNLKKGFELLKMELGISLEDIEYSVFGVSGCDSKNDYDKINEQILKLGLNKEKVYLCNDGVLAFYAQASEPGIVVIAGTGSIVLGIDEDGKIERSGGWGYNISDAGSGQWIGNEALKRTLLYCDNCYDYSPLFEQIKKYFNVETFAELPYVITEINDYFEIAKVTSIVGKLALEGEEVSREIMRSGAKILANLIKSNYDKLKFNDKTGINIVFSGGVLKNKFYDETLRGYIKEKLNHSDINFFIQENVPAYGGIKLATRMMSRGESYGK